MSEVSQKLKISFSLDRQGKNTRPGRKSRGRESFVVALDENPDWRALTDYEILLAEKKQPDIILHYVGW